MKIIINLIIFLISVQFTFAQAVAKKIDSICQAIHYKNPEVGISVGFIEHGREHFFNYGKISRKSDFKVNENTVYEIGSITKLLTGNLIAQAQDEGKLKIDDFIDDYLPKQYIVSDEIKGKLKISDLASHQSGLPDFDFSKLIDLNPKQPLNISKEAIHSLINDSTKLLDYCNYRYSNISYFIMGIILEYIYSKDFDALLKEKILLPAQMTNTLTTDFHHKKQVTGYDINGVEQDSFSWNSLFAPAGLIKSNTSDMTKLLKILLSNKGNIGKATAITEKTFYKNTQRKIGFGLEIERNGEDAFFYKTGDTFSCSSVFAYDRQDDWGMIIMINQNNPDLIRALINTIYAQAL